MPHDADTDTTKTHVHCTIWCEGEVDLTSLEASLTQLKQGQRPLSTRLINPRDNKPCLCNSIDDNTLYDEHNSAYLSAKGLSRNICDIPRSNWVTDDDSEFHDLLFASADEFLASFCVGGSTKAQAIGRAIKAGVSPFDLILQGYNPSSVNATARVYEHADYVKYEPLYERAIDDIHALRHLLDLVTDYCHKVGYDVFIHEDLSDVDFIDLSTGLPPF